MAVTCDAPKDYKYLLDAIKPDTTLDFNFCRKMCKIQARHGDAEACNYFRWETEKSNATTYCSLQTTCLSGEYNPTDPEGCQNNEHCRHGHWSGSRNGGSRRPKGSSIQEEKDDTGSVWRQQDPQGRDKVGNILARIYEDANRVA